MSAGFDHSQSKLSVKNSTLIFHAWRNNVKDEEFDEDAEIKMLAAQKFTLSQYLNLVTQDKNRRGEKEWNDYNGRTYKDPNTVLLACLYDMLRHVMWKMTNNQHDISE